MSNQPFGAEVLEVAVPPVGGPVAAVAEVVDRDHAKGADRGQGASFGATQVVALVAHGHRLAIESARQVEALGEHVARVDWVEVARVVIEATAAASRRPVPGVIPTRIVEERHGSPLLLLEWRRRSWCRPGALRSWRSMCVSLRPASRRNSHRATM